MVKTTVPLGKQWEFTLSHIYGHHQDFCCTFRNLWEIPNLDLHFPLARGCKTTPITLQFTPIVMKLDKGPSKISGFFLQKTSWNSGVFLIWVDRPKSLTNLPGFQIDSLFLCCCYLAASFPTPHPTQKNGPNMSKNLHPTFSIHMGSLSRVSSKGTRLQKSSHFLVPQKIPPPLHGPTNSTLGSLNLKPDTHPPLEHQACSHKWECCTLRSCPDLQDSQARNLDL